MAEPLFYLSEPFLGCHDLLLKPVFFSLQGFLLCLEYLL